MSPTHPGRQLAEFAAEMRALIAQVWSLADAAVVPRPLPRGRGRNR